MIPAKGTRWRKLGLTPTEWVVVGHRKTEGFDYVLLQKLDPATGRIPTTRTRTPNVPFPLEANRFTRGFHSLFVEIRAESEDVAS